MKHNEHENLERLVKAGLTPKQAEGVVGAWTGKESALEQATMNIEKSHEAKAFVKQMNEGTDADVKKAAEELAKRVERSMEETVMQTLSGVPVHTSDWIDKDTMLVFHPGQMDAMRSAMTKNTFTTATRSESTKALWNAGNPPPDQDVVCAKEGAFMCERARRQLWSLHQRCLEVERENKAWVATGKKLEEARAVAKNQQTKILRLRYELSAPQNELQRKLVQTVKERDALTAKLKDFEGRADDLVVQLEAVTTCHMEACRKHDVMRKERDEARKTVAHLIDSPDRIGLDDLVWDRISGNGPFAVVKLDGVGGASLWTGQKTIERAVLSLKKAEPLSFWKRHQAKVFLLAGLVTGSALLLHGLFMARELGWR